VTGIKYENIDLSTLRNEHGELDRDKLKEATAKQRRGYLYNLYMEKGHIPKPQRYYAELFDSSQSRISVDLKKVRKYIAENLDSEKAKVDIELFGDKIKEKLLEEGEPYKAWKVVSQKTEMLQELGEVTKAADKLDVNQELEISIGDLPNQKEEQETEDD